MTYNEYINNILNTRGRFNCEGYKERHHIIPKCMNGTNDEDNLIDLYPEEHYHAHKLLAEENSENEKLVFAWSMMMCGYKKYNNISEEDYGELKRMLVGHKVSDETKQKISKANKGRKLSKEAREKMSKSHLGKKFSEEVKKKMSASRMGHKGVHPKDYIIENLRKIAPIYNKKRKGIKFSKEVCKHMGDAHKGLKHTKEHNLHIAQAEKGIHAGKVYMTNGIKAVRIKKEDISKYEKLGYVRGTIQKGIVYIKK